MGKVFVGTINRILNLLVKLSFMPLLSGILYITFFSVGITDSFRQEFVGLSSRKF